MDYEISFDSIVKEVLRRLEKPQKNALVIFTGGSLGFNQAVKQLNLLKEKGWNLKVFLSKNAEKVLTLELISRLLKIDEVLVESTLSDENMLLEDMRAVIFPVLTMNSAAKIALGIADTIATHTAASAIMRGLPIIAAKDGCDPKNKERLKGRFSKVPNAYVKKINSYLKDLIDYGIKLVEAEAIYETVKSCSMGSTVKIQDQAEEVNSDIVNRKEQTIDKRLITREDVMLAKNQGLKEIYVARNTIITALAKDASRELGVEIKCI